MGGIRPYLRRPESLTVCGCHYKGKTFLYIRATRVRPHCLIIHLQRVVWLAKKSRASFRQVCLVPRQRKKQLRFSRIISSSQCKSDGKFRSLAPGFPKLIEHGTNQLFLFRGPKFNRTITFDPVVELEEEEDDDNEYENGRASIINMNAIMFVAIIGTFFF